MYPVSGRRKLIYWYLKANLPVRICLICSSNFKDAGDVLTCLSNMSSPRGSHTGAWPLAVHVPDAIPWTFRRALQQFSFDWWGSLFVWPLFRHFERVCTCTVRFSNSEWHWTLPGIYWWHSAAWELRCASKSSYLVGLALAGGMIDY